MKKTFKILLYILLQLLVLTACASKSETPAPTSDTTASTTDETSLPIQTPTREYPVQQEDTKTEDTESKKEDTPKTVAEEEPQISFDFFTEKEWDIPDELTQDEMAFFTDFMNNTENNGFLQSEYTTPTDADLEEVFYNGAGVSAHSLTAEEEAAYEEKVSWGIETDVERLTTEELDRFLLRKTGYSYAEMNVPLHWVYLEQFDAYVSDHGDTNWREYLCLGGRIQGDMYEVYYQAVYHEENDNGGVLTVRKNGDDYMIVSNQWDYVPDLSRLSNREIKELAFFAENKELWNRMVPPPAKLSYAVFDLHHDGSLELITCTPAEPAEPAEYRFYQADDTFTALQELDQESHDALYAELETEKDEIVWKKQHRQN